jgi:hypothetical protein
MNIWLWFFISAALFATGQQALGLDADCYDQGEDYYIPASDLLEAKKKALLCFFAEISFKTSIKEGNQEVDFKQETNLEAKSSLIDWQGLRKASTQNLYRWSIRDVSANLKALSQSHEKQIIPVTKEVQEVWHSSQIKKEIIELVSTPSGATVGFDGLESACQTPCKLEVIHGVHTVSLWKPDYSRMNGTIRVDGTRDLFPFELKENIGRIVFQNCPTDTSILIDGTRLGLTSNGQLKMAPGNYILELEHPEHFKTNQTVSVKVSDNVLVQCNMKPKIGGLEISAVSSKGEPIKATVEIDGIVVGKTPGVYDVRAGSRRVRLTYEEEAWEDAVAVEKSAVTHLSKTLSPIESEAEKQRKNAMKALSIVASFGQMSDQNLIEKSSSRQFDFKQCGSADPDMGSSLRIRISKNLTENFGLSLGFVSADYEVCHSSFESKTYREVVDKYKISYQGLTGGIHYTLYTDAQTTESSAMTVYRRWFTLRLSLLKGLDLKARNEGSGFEWAGKSNHKSIAEISFIDFIAGHFQLSLLEFSTIQDSPLPISSPVEIREISMLNILGIGMVF